MKVKATKKAKKAKKPSKTSQTTVEVRSDVISATLRETTSQELIINVFENLKTQNMFINMSKNFQQWKLVRIRVLVSPSPTDTFYFLNVALQTTDQNQIETDTNQFGKIVTSKVNVVKKIFSTSGRQNDFGYWFDTSNANDGPSCQLSVSTLKELASTNSVEVKLVVSYFVAFRFACVKTGLTKTLTKLKDGVYVSSANDVKGEVN